MADNIFTIVLPDGTSYNIKDISAVTNISWDSTNRKIQKTINETTSDVVVMPIVAGTGANSAVGGRADCIASGQDSFAYGYDAQATGKQSIAFYRGIATKQGAIAMGGVVTGLTATTASGIGSIAIGFSTYASGTYAISIGYNNTASGTAAINIGTMCEASANYSLSFGYRTKAGSVYQTTLGKCNVEDTSDTYCLIVGNGTDDNNRSNAMTVDWNGNINANNIVASTSISNTGLISFKNSNNTAVYTTQLPIYDGSSSGSGTTTIIIDCGTWDT